MIFIKNLLKLYLIIAKNFKFLKFIFERKNFAKILQHLINLISWKKWNTFHNSSVIQKNYKFL